MNKNWLLSTGLVLTVAVMAACGDVDEANEGNNVESENQEEVPSGNNESALEEGETVEQPDMPEPDLESIPDVVAEVNGEEIQREEFEANYVGQFQQASMQSQLTGEEVDEEQLKIQTVENMILSELLLQEADSADFDASEEEIAQTLDEIVAQNGLESTDEFMATLEEQGMSEEEVMSQIETQVKVDQLIARETGEIDPTDEELEEAYDQLIAQQEQMGEEDVEMPSFEELKPELEEQVKSQKEGQAAQILVEDLRENADITINL